MYPLCQVADYPDSFHGTEVSSCGTTVPRYILPSKRDQKPTAVTVWVLSVVLDGVELKLGGSVLKFVKGIVAPPNEPMRAEAWAPGPEHEGSHRSADKGDGGDRLHN